MNVPTLQEAQTYLLEAAEQNPGLWVQHSIFTAEAAKAIASHHPGIDSNTAYILGYLHDIGRREGVTDMRHILDGYYFMQNQGFPDVARICLTHSFPILDITSAAGQWDCSDEEYRFVQELLTKIDAYTAYDRLIQLCDALALPSGFCLIEKRLVDVALRRGVNMLTLQRWRAYLSIQNEFEQLIGHSIYHLLPGVVENTFGFDEEDTVQSSAMCEAL